MNLPLRPGEDHIDTLPSICEMPFDQVLRNQVEPVLAGLSVPFISKPDLIESKRQVGRMPDLAT